MKLEDKSVEESPVTAQELDCDDQQQELDPEVWKTKKFFTGISVA